MEVYLLYQRKTPKSNWKLIGTADEPLGVARIAYNFEAREMEGDLGLRVWYSDHNFVIVEDVSPLKPENPLVQPLDRDVYGEGAYNTYQQIANDLHERGLPKIRRTDTCDGLGCNERLTSQTMMFYFYDGIGGVPQKQVLCPVCYSSATHRDAIRKRDAIE